MSLTAARALTLSVWEEKWKNHPIGNLPLEIENREFKRPKDADWGRLTLALGETTSIAVGSDVERTPFVVTLQYFIPEGKGTLNAYDARDVLKALRNISRRDGQIVVKYNDVSLVGPLPVVDGFASFNVTARGYFDIYGPA